MNNDMTNNCCEQCTHGPDTPCRDRIACLTEGPLCHQSASCDAVKRAFRDRMTFASHETPVIFIGMGTCGLGAGAAETEAAVRLWCQEQGITASIVAVGCIGLCALEPLVDVKLPGRARISLGNVTAQSAGELLSGVFTGRPDHHAVIGQFEQENQKSWHGIPPFFSHPFFKHQKRRVLENCGLIDPSSLGQYIARGGYSGLSRAFTRMTQEEVCSEVELSGLRGRGGGGFPTGRKWRFALNTSSTTKYIICNADEGDPGAFMDRAVIEGDPHRLLEGLLIAGYAFGATSAYIYIRAEYPLAIERLEYAIGDMRRAGLLGANILDSGISMDVVVKKGAGAFVCGEETALINSIEGKRGMPRPRPPFPAVSGLFGKPTIINNVETLANVPDILAKGSGWFNALGTEDSRGTKVFALSGNVTYTGLVEVEMGRSIREIVFDIGGGIPGGKAYKAAQIGGPSGGCIPLEHIETRVDYESLKRVGAMMGSGGLVVMDEDTCMVDVARFFMEFIGRESCGKCIPCREGTRRMLEIMDSITTPRKTEQNTDALERFRAITSLEKLAQVIRQTSLCGLGQTAPNPVLSTLRYFRNEYEQHIFDRTCPTRSCKQLLTFTIDEELCKGCTLCLKKCPVEAIKGAAKAPHYIIDDLCVRCGVCRDVCRFDAVKVH
ncbi:4Fe-4S binding protein [Myxococcota bacterium]|nr:4Fe-4S binding protein [Myxococcota bacterium]MBU1534349.1 4Fe-4S binding protein [Myxococcota bacterium]